MQRFNLLILISLLLSSLSVFASIDTGLRHVYNFEQASGNLTDQVGEVNSTSVKVTDQEAAGISGNGWDFERAGSDSATMATAIVDGWWNMTINAWVKAESGSEGSRNTIFAATDASGVTGIRYTDADILENVATTDSEYSQVPGTGIAVGGWTMVTLVWNNTHIRGYVNGTKTGTDGGVGGDTLVSNIGAFIGAQGTGNYFDGIIDELYIWNRSLNSAEVSQLWNSGTGFFYHEFSGSFPPSLSYPVCTSCKTGTNNTIDSTPTINITCIDPDGCNAVRIANASSYNYSTATESRNCTQGSGSIWVCTLPASDQLTNEGFSQPLYFWANDNMDNAHKTANASISVTYYSAYNNLDGVAGDRNYEFETTANITTVYNYIDIIDSTGRYRNIADTPFEYYIGLLRTDKFNDGIKSKNMTSGTAYPIGIDNNTELYNLSVNLTGFDSTGFPSRTWINFTGNVYHFPGKIVEGKEYQNEFAYGSNYSTYNITYTTSGLKTVYINYSTRGNLSRSGYLNFTITSYDLDEGNDFNFTENFTTDININLTKSFNVSFMSVYDDFEINNTDRYTLYGDARITSGNPDDYIFLHSSVPGDSESRITFDYIPIDNMSMFNFSACKTATWAGGGGSISYIISATDLTNEVYLFFESFGTGSTPSSTANSYEWIGSKQGSVWTIYRNGTKEGSGNIGGLNPPMYLMFRVISSSTGTAADWLIYDFRTSGIRLNRTNDGYVPNGTFISNNFTLPNNVQRVHLAASEYLNSNQSIDYFVSNDDGATWEPVSLNNFHTFTSTGNDVKAKFVLNSTSSSSTPYIPGYSITIIPSAPANLAIDIGADDIIDMNYSRELNATSTPIRYAGNDSGFNNYIEDYCPHSPYCAVPVVITVGSGGIIQLSSLNVSQDINPVFSDNLSGAQTGSLLNITPHFEGGILQADGVRADFRGSKNITVVAHQGDYTQSLNRTIRVKYSNFNLSYPSGVDYWEMFPSSRNQTDIEPYGQNRTAGIWEVSFTGYDTESDIYARYNESIESCVTRMTFIGKNYSYNQADGLDLYYPFDGEPIDYSKNRHDPAISGATYNSTGGINSSGAYSFDGINDEINTGLLYPSTWNDPFTVSTWMYVPTGATWDNGYLSNIVGRGTYAGSFGLVRNTADNKVRLYMRGDGGAVAIGTIITRDAWYHIVGVYNGTGIAVYANGVLESSGEASLTGAPDAVEWDIGGDGRYSGGSGSFYNGSIDEVSIWNRSLNSSEVNSLYLAASTKYHSNITLQNLTSGSQPIMERMDRIDSKGYIWTKTMINCSNDIGAYIIPYFCFFSLCHECVKTSDWQSNCEWYE